MLSRVFQGGHPVSQPRTRSFFECWHLTVLDTLAMLQECYRTEPLAPVGVLPRGRSAVALGRALGGVVGFGIGPGLGLGIGESDFPHADEAIALVEGRGD